MTFRILEPDAACQSVTRKIYEDLRVEGADSLSQLAAAESARADAVAKSHDPEGFGEMLDGKLPEKLDKLDVFALNRMITHGAHVEHYHEALGREHDKIMADVQAEAQKLATELRAKLVGDLGFRDDQAVGKLLDQHPRLVELRTRANYDIARSTGDVMRNVRSENAGKLAVLRARLDAVRARVLRSITEPDAAPAVASEPTEVRGFSRWKHPHAGLDTPAPYPQPEFGAGVGGYQPEADNASAPVGIGSH